ncbi:hypothetical protein [Lamprocystis purpurea]|uniref:hypothetical protein n=1 Tax=Lamprocystis purpurea TaxID=61598 RepID=UPI001B7FDF91|nr:hypothetical protein [Lamprocystis purpurea]
MDQRLHALHVIAVIVDPGEQGRQPQKEVAVAPSSKGDDRTSGQQLRDARTIVPMRTVIETPTFQKQAEKVWTEAQRLEFIGDIEREV